MKDRGGRVDFDEYSDRYEDLVAGQLAFFSKDRGYFSENKVSIVAERLGRSPERILDFGCGIGLNLPCLARRFPAAKLHATDISGQSLAHVRAKHPEVSVIEDRDLDGHAFDLIFVSGVFHHVPVGQREGVMNRLSSLLSAAGSLFVFEHNPYNPVTRRMVATCPFDGDAVLVSLPGMKALMRRGSGFAAVGGGYCLFFPESLGFLRPVEPWLRWLPLGGQHFTMGTRRGDDPR